MLEILNQSARNMACGLRHMNPSQRLTPQVFSISNTNITFSQIVAVINLRNVWTECQGTWYVYHATWADLSDEIQNSFPPPLPTL
jgi:hypothetical protein